MTNQEKIEATELMLTLFRAAKYEGLAAVEERVRRDPYTTLADELRREVLNLTLEYSEENVVA